MFGLNKLVNLRIGTKLGVTSALGVALVVAIVATMMIGNWSIRKRPPTPTTSKAS